MQGVAVRGSQATRHGRRYRGLRASWRQDHALPPQLAPAPTARCPSAAARPPAGAPYHVAPRPGVAVAALVRAERAAAQHTHARWEEDAHCAQDKVAVMDEARHACMGWAGVQGEVGAVGRL